MHYVVGYHTIMSPKTISATDAKNNFSEILSLVAYKGEQFVIERKGKPIAILSPQTKSPRTPNPHRLINQLKKYPLGLSWEQAKPLLDDLHLPKL